MTREDKLIDFIKNELTDITWNEFAKILHEKFGDETESLAGELAVLLDMDLLSREATESLKQARKHLNVVF